MNAESLSKVGRKLVTRCGTRNPFEIARQLGIEVMFCDDFGPLKGMYRVIKRNRFIFINKNMSERMQIIVCAHELGHDQLHRKLAKTNALREFMLYDMTTRPEYEAKTTSADCCRRSVTFCRSLSEDRISRREPASLPPSCATVMAIGW